MKTKPASLENIAPDHLPPVVIPHLHKATRDHAFRDLAKGMKRAIGEAQQIEVPGEKRQTSLPAFSATALNKELGEYPKRFFTGLSETLANSPEAFGPMLLEGMAACAKAKRKDEAVLGEVAFGTVGFLFDSIKPGTPIFGWLTHKWPRSKDRTPSQRQYLGWAGSICAERPVILEKWQQAAQGLMREMPEATADLMFGISDMYAKASDTNSRGFQAELRDRAAFLMNSFMGLNSAEMARLSSEAAFDLSYAFGMSSFFGFGNKWLHAKGQMAASRIIASQFDAVGGILAGATEASCNGWSSGKSMRAVMDWAYQKIGACDEAQAEKMRSATAWWLGNSSRVCSQGHKTVEAIANAVNRLLDVSPHLLQDIRRGAYGSSNYFMPLSRSQGLLPTAKLAVALCDGRERRFLPPGSVPFLT